MKSKSTAQVRPPKISIDPLKCNQRRNVGQGSIHAVKSPYPLGIPVVSISLLIKHPNKIEEECFSRDI